MCLANNKFAFSKLPTNKQEKFESFKNNSNYTDLFSLRKQSAVHPIESLAQYSIALQLLLQCKYVDYRSRRQHDFGL